jgi:UDPglucose 6-dehydrogenase
MVKYASNAFLAARISFINEIARICERVDADAKLVAEGMGMDKRIGPHYLDAGIGYGGSCFPKDSLALKQLASNSGYHFQLLSAVIEVNELQKLVIDKLRDTIDRLRQSQSACSASRSSPTPTTCARPRAWTSPVRGGRRPCSRYDPAAMGACGRLQGRIHETPTSRRELDALIVITEWNEFRHLDLPGSGLDAWPTGRQPQHLRSRRDAGAGLTYQGIGRD